MAGAKPTWEPRDDPGAQGPTAALGAAGLWLKPTFVSLGSRKSANARSVPDPLGVCSEGTQRVPPHCSPPGLQCSVVRREVS